MVGQRRKKLEARQARHAEEEAQRQELDKIFREENEAQRSASIDRAKKLQYYGSDTVKNFHSRVVLLEVLQVRLSDDDFCSLYPS